MHQYITGPHFFGYGSLVNQNTHAYRGGHIMSIRGWRRLWARAPGRDVAFLTVQPDANGCITGLAAALEGGDWAALDQREASYDRLPIAHDDIISGPICTDLAIYAVPPENRLPASTDAPVLLSYIDVVFQGYIRETGKTGLMDFIRSTDNWNAPIKDDRATPIYPRAQPLTPNERQMINDALQQLGAMIF